MIKMIFCLRRLERLTQQEFQHYWLNVHAPIVREVAPLLRIRKYVQSHSFHEPSINPAIAARGNEVAPYDGIAELYWDSIEDILAVGSTKEARDAGRRLLADEANFIDLPNSPLFFVRENHIIG